MRRLAVVALLVVGATASSGNAQTITNGFTFAVSTDFDRCTVGTHYHSNTGGAYGNPAGKAEVGNYQSECVRGLSEYNLAGLATATNAYVTFDVFKLGGLFIGFNDVPFNGTIHVVSYVGNNVEDLSDWGAPSSGNVGSFSTVGLAVNQVISLDITSIFNNAILGGQSSLGIRLERVGESPTNAGAVTFENFHLTSDDQSTITSPEPATWCLTAAGLAGMVFARRRVRHRV